MNLATTALHFAELGYRVFPCRAGDKTPATSGGLNDGTCDLHKVEQTWNRNQRFNIGLTAGKIDDPDKNAVPLFVLDIDVKHGPNEWHTPEIACELQTVAGAVARTPSGGFHYYFRQPSGADLRNTTSEIAYQVDTRATGGYVVIPPSITEQGQYQWVPGCELNRVPEDLPEPPPWVLRALAKAKQQTPKPADNPAPATYGSGTEVIPDGKRNATLASIAGNLRRIGLDQSAIAAALQEVNNKRCKPPMDYHEVEKIAESVSRYEVDQVATLAAEGAAIPQPEVLTLDIARLVADFPNLRPAVVARIMRRGETINIIAKSKVGKSWFGYLLAICVATGRDWLGFKTERGRVIIIDNELHPETLANRLKAVLSAMGLTLDDVSGWIDIICLRGQCRDINTVAPILRNIPHGKYSLIICDALYRLLPDGTSENDNAQMMAVFNAIDKYGEQTGAAFVLVHHASKGGQSDKDIVDVGSGAGAISRAADGHLVLRPHEEVDAVVLDARLRSWEPLQPIGLRWAFPVWYPDDNLDPNLLKGRKAPAEERKQEADKGDCEKILEALKDGPKSVSKLSCSVGIGKLKLERLIGLMVHGKRLVESEATIRGNTCTVYAINPDAPKAKAIGNIPQETEYDSFA